MNSDTMYLLIIGTLILSIIILSIYLYLTHSRSKKTQKDSENKDKIITQNKNEIWKLKKDQKLIEKIKNIIDDGSSLRRGLITKNLVTKNPSTNVKTRFEVRVEVREIERTLNNSKIEVTSYKILNNSDQSITNLKEMKKFFGGWITSLDVNWLKQINGREKVIDELLEEFGDDETI